MKYSTVSICSDPDWLPLNTSTIEEILAYQRKLLWLAQQNYYWMQQQNCSQPGNGSNSGQAAKEFGG